MWPGRGRSQAMRCPRVLANVLSHMNVVTVSCLQNNDRQSSCPALKKSKLPFSVLLFMKKERVCPPKEAQENCLVSVAAQSQDARGVS